MWPVQGSGWISNCSHHIGQYHSRGFIHVIVRYKIIYIAGEIPMLCLSCLLRPSVLGRRVEKPQVSKSSWVQCFCVWGSCGANILRGILILYSQDSKVCPVNPTGSSWQPPLPFGKTGHLFCICKCLMESLNRQLIPEYLLGVWLTFGPHTASSKKKVMPKNRK